MCGICGIYNFSRGSRVPEKTIKNMCEVMKHRGPDEDGFYFNDNIALGMRRLKIIDLFTGSQPIYNENKSIVTVFNGEIYNFQELRDALVKNNHYFYTNSDTEVIVHLYEDFGEEFVNYLNGMFAIALWDNREKTLFLYRDRMGEKPLHYLINKEGIIFASEIKSILCNSRYQKEIDLEALYHYFTYYYIPAPFTIYKNIKKLLPGHYLKCIDTGEVVIQKYWDFRHQPDHNKSEDYFVEGLRELLIKSIKMRLVSDVPLGAFLSGGIDSSTIVAFMSSLVDEPIKTFSIGFGEKEYNELNYARVIARKFKTDHHEFIVEPSAVDLIDKLIWHFDEPFNDSSAIPTFLLSEITRKYVTVALSGDGGDELFAGYDSYRAMMKRRKLKYIPKWVRKIISHQIGDRLPEYTYGKRYLQSLCADDIEFFFYGTDRKKNLFSNDYLKIVNKFSSYNVIKDYILNNNTEYLSRFMYIDSKLYLPDDILVKVDRMSMANSLETRIPFLDHNLIEFVAQIPEKYKMKGSISKYILKKTMENILPNNILNRNKQGFVIPLDVWFKNELKEMVEDIFSNKLLNETGFFNTDYILKIFNDHMMGRYNHRRFLWSILLFQLWYKNHFQNRIT